MKRLLLLSWLIIALRTMAVEPSAFFGIEVVDEATGRGVPLVELRTVNAISYWTDSAGRVAFLEPGLMDEHVFFSVSADGYVFPRESLGYRGVTVRTTPGTLHRVEVRRSYPAERLYRLTGQGIYRDTVLLGLRSPVLHPVINARVLGQDSTMAIEFRDRAYWFWGDTLQPAHPLGNFDMSMATTAPGALLEPEVAINYDYVTADNGFAKRVAPVEGEGPTWLSGFTIVETGEGLRLAAGYSKIRNGLETYARGVVVLEEEEQIFRVHAAFSADAPLHPVGHGLVLGEGGRERVHFMNPLPLVRVETTLEAMAEPDRYEAFTPLLAGSRREEPRVERNAAGEIVYGWKRDTPEIGPREQEALIEAGLIEEDERLFAVRDWRTGEEVRLHAGSVSWNDFRQRWILVASQIFGRSTLGEIWFAEADSPLGPWMYGERIVTHGKYTFYNPRHHPFLDREGGRVIFFEGTYTALFSGVERPTPRYDYNQILYRLDLSDSRLDLPVAVYRTKGGCLATATDGAEVTGRPVFWAWERAGEGRVGLTCDGHEADRCKLAEGGEGDEILFYAPTGHQEGSVMVPLVEFSGLAQSDLPVHVLPHPAPRGPVLPILKK